MDKKSTFLPPMVEALPSYSELFFGDLDLLWNYLRLVQGLFMLIATMHINFGSRKRLFYLNRTHLSFGIAGAIFDDPPTVLLASLAIGQPREVLA